MTAAFPGGWKRDTVAGAHAAICHYPIQHPPGRCGRLHKTQFEPMSVNRERTYSAPRTYAAIHPPHGRGSGEALTHSV
jgi:hypothetical protein